MATRTWGDGATDTRQHVIADIHYGHEASDLVCRCGMTFVAPTPDALASLWRAHGGKVLDHTDVADRSQPIDPAQANMRKVAAYEAMRRLGAGCTCDTAPIRLCPNFVNGDERE